MQNEESHRIGMHLQLLSKCWGYRDKADDIFQLIPNGSIIANSKGLGFFKLAQLLHWFNKVQFEDNLKTKNLYEEFPLDEFQNNIEDLTFDNIVLSLRNLNQIDSIKTHTIFKENEELILGKLIFENIDLSLAQLADVNFEIGYAVLSSLLGKDDFKNWLLAQPLNKITRVLIKFSAIEKMKIESTHDNLISGFINSISDSVFISGIGELRFDLLCSCLNEVASINDQVKAKFNNIINKIGLPEFAKKLNETGDKKFDFSLMAQGFNNLYVVTPLFFEKLYKQEYNNIIKSASVTSLDNFTNGLKAIAKISEDKAREIFTDDKLNIEVIATDSKNYDLKNINRIIYFLKAYSLTKTEAVIGYFSLEDFAFKFERELNFDKATEYLSQLYPFNEKRIWEVVYAIGVESFYKRCKEKEIKLIIQGLSKISKIHKEVAQEVFEMIIEHRDIKYEMKSIIQFEDLSQKIREVKKVSNDDTLVVAILNSIGVNGFVQRAEKSGKNQILMGFGSLSEIDFPFTKKVGIQLCKKNVKYANIFYGNSFLRNLIN